MAEPPTITRAELLAQVREKHGVTVGERELRYWEGLGVLPIPVREVRGNARHATYPWFHPVVVAHVPALRAERHTWSDVRTQVRAVFRAEANRAGSHPDALANSTPVGALPVLPVEIVSALQQFIAQLNQDHHTGITSVQLQFRSGEDYPDWRYTIFPEGDDGVSTPGDLSQDGGIDKNESASLQ